MLLEVCELMGIEARQAIAVGDGANDLPMMAAAGLSIAYHPKPAVAETGHDRHPQRRPGPRAGGAGLKQPGGGSA